MPPESGTPPAGGTPPAAGTPPIDPTEGPPPDPDDRESAYELLRRGQALAAKRHFAQAAIVLGRAARLEPHKGSILEALGRALYNSGQHERARETFERLLEIDPSSDYGHYALGQSLKQLGRRREARTHLRIAVALAPSSRLYAGALRRLGPAPRGGPAEEGRSGRTRRGPGDGDPGEGPEPGPEAPGGSDRDESGPGRATD
ncbi:MAG TPA: tetratricopeptide repeat protein [Candidatus Binatia bacterium]|nr:tetratricopeptide repeat protein [Candidatus Binatia bacterium]